MLAKIIRGVVAAIRAKPGAFTAVALGVFALDIFLPPLVLSVARKRWDFFTFNPWLSRLPEYLASGEKPVGEKLAFLPKLALFWFSADLPYGAGADWGFVVDVSDILRFAFMSLIFGAYFALWLYRRDPRHCGWAARASGPGGVMGVFASIAGFSGGPCSVVGCGAPVVPLVGLAFAGLSTGTLQALATVSRVATAVVLLTVTVGVGYLGYLVGADAADRRSTIPA